MRLIDADELKTILSIRRTIETIQQAIDNAPTVDAVPVVRCKDCRHAVDYYHEGDCYCSNPKWGLNYFGGSWEFYCADAERRNND